MRMCPDLHFELEPILGILPFDSVVDAWVDTGQDFMDDSGGFKMGVEGSELLLLLTSYWDGFPNFPLCILLLVQCGWSLYCLIIFLPLGVVFKGNTLLGTPIFLSNMTLPR